jgi:hypothetical protein
MPTLTELALLGKQALLAFVTQVLTECAALKARVEQLLAEVASLRTENAALNADFRGPKPTYNPGTPTPVLPRNTAASCW